MPLRRNECTSCGHTFRVLEGPGGAQPTCPACGGRRTRRLLPHVAVQFRGDGFYSTKYRKGGATSAESAGDD